MKPAPKTRLLVRIPTAHDTRLRELALENGITIAEYARRIIADHLDHRAFSEIIAERFQGRGPLEPPRGTDDSTP